jgi:hypothetical protein
LNSTATDKEAAALQLAQRHPGRTGRSAVLSCVASCATYRLRQNARGLIEPRQKPGKCLHYYHYFRHPDLGLCSVRLQSWFPFSARVGRNGREGLYQQLRQRGCDCRRLGNRLVQVADPALAQALLDEQTRTDWPALLRGLVEPVHPLWDDLHGRARAPYYWMTEPSAWATDILFRDPDFLAAWYPRWRRHGLTALSCRDALHYLGKHVPPDAPKSWQHLRRGVADLGRRAEVSQACNQRLAESLAGVAETTALGKLLEPLSKPVRDAAGRRQRALNPSAGRTGPCCGRWRTARSCSTASATATCASCCTRPRPTRASGASRPPRGRAGWRCCGRTGSSSRCRRRIATASAPWASGSPQPWWPPTRPT